MIDTLRKFKLHARTIHWDSEIIIVFKLLKLIHGIGKGNAAGTAIWALISSTILNIVGNSNYYAFYNICFVDVTTQYMFACVDNILEIRSMWVLQKAYNHTACYNNC